VSEPVAVSFQASEEDEAAADQWPALADVLGNDGDHGLIRIRVTAPCEPPGGIPAGLGTALLRTARDCLSPERQAGTVRYGP
jgi:hypothetical protein